MILGKRNNQCEHGHMLTPCVCSVIWVLCLFWFVVTCFSQANITTMHDFSLFAVCEKMVKFKRTQYYLIRLWGFCELTMFTFRKRTTLWHHKSAHYNVVLFFSFNNIFVCHLQFTTDFLPMLNSKKPLKTLQVSHFYCCGVTRTVKRVCSLLRRL